MNSTPNTDSAELDKFSAEAWQWWNPEGDMRSLHIINPVRLAYIDKCVGLAGKTVLDLGCGGGILSEAMAEKGAIVTGIDASGELIDIARSHSELSGLDIDYIAVTGEEYAAENPSAFDVITCMELLEHVPDITSLIGAAARMIKPGGHLITATLNRNLRSYTAAIIGAEYILRLLPKGTHDYKRFIKPAELAAVLRHQGFRVADIAGMSYIPGLDYCTLTSWPSVNYLLHAVND